MKFNQKVYRWQGIAIRNTARCAIAASTLLFPHPAVAQITPDATLRVNSNVSPIGDALTIDSNIDGLIRANGGINQKGQVELVANRNNNNSWRSPANCQRLRRSAVQRASITTPAKIPGFYR